MKDELQKQYQGFINTPLLWQTSLLGLLQFRLPSGIATRYSSKDLITSTLLGKRAETFFAHQLSGVDSLNIVAHNFQIQESKKTIGEIDFIITHKSTIYHIEVVYKFYLWDYTQNYNTEIAYWIGPNRKDRLGYKLNKLKNKQLPLLYHNSTAPYLHVLNLNPKNMIQTVHFKAQLFVPFNTHVPFKAINKHSVVGYYLSIFNIENLSNYTIYIPEKLQWFVTPHIHVNWLTFKNAMPEILEKTNREISTLIWAKYHNKLYKLFITWW